MKKYIAIFEVPDNYEPKRFKATNNVDGWFTNSEGFLTSVPSSLKEIREGDKYEGS